MARVGDLVRVGVVGGREAEEVEEVEEGGVVVVEAEAGVAEEVVAVARVAPMGVQEEGEATEEVGREAQAAAVARLAKQEALAVLAAKGWEPTQG